MRTGESTEGLPRGALESMRRYYVDRVPYHDGFMSWDGNDAMEELLEPVIRLFQGDISGGNVLEVACGTGNWTQVLAKRARTVVATDLIEGYLDLARTKGYDGNVEFRQADAYSLEGVGGPFTAAFAADWWSHIPRSMIDTFHETLHSVLRPKARVIMVDMLRTESFELAFLRYDAEGNEVQMRTLPSGGSYEIIKNFPNGEELRSILRKWTDDVCYSEIPDLGRWVLRYTLPG